MRNTQVQSRTDVGSGDARDVPATIGAVYTLRPMDVAIGATAIGSGATPSSLAFAPSIAMQWHRSEPRWSDGAPSCGACGMQQSCASDVTPCASGQAQKGDVKTSAAIRPKVTLPKR